MQLHNTSHTENIICKIIIFKTFKSNPLRNAILKISKTSQVQTKSKHNGVRQGGILSPHLFNVYVDDLSQILNRCRTGCLSGNITINHLMYADDLVLLSPSATGLRELLCTCEEFSISHDVVYNSRKSSVLICRNKAMDHAAPPVFTVNGSIIGESDKVKYLGHIICNDMSDDDDMMRQR